MHKNADKDGNNKLTNSTKTIYQSRPRAESILFSPLHCRGYSRDTKNAKRTQLHHQLLFAHLATRATGHERRVTIHPKRTQLQYRKSKIGNRKSQISPNFTQKRSQKLINSSTYLLIYLPKARTFLHFFTTFHQNLQKNARLL